MRSEIGKHISIAYNSDLSGDSFIIQGDARIEVPFSELEKMVSNIRFSANREWLFRYIENLQDEDVQRCVNVIKYYMGDEHGKKEE